MIPWLPLVTASTQNDEIEEDEEVPPLQEESNIASQDSQENDKEKYWDSDHHKFEWCDYMINQDDRSWHALGIAVQDSFISKGNLNLNFYNYKASPRDYDVIRVVMTSLSRFNTFQKNINLIQIFHGERNLWKWIVSLMFM